MKKYAFLIILFSVNLYACENETAYSLSREKWNNSGIKEYVIKLNFKAFSPLSGIWELNVKDGAVQLCRFNGKAADSCNKVAEMFTMESLYKTAGGSKSAGKNDPFIIGITYGENGFIKKLSKVRNPEYKHKVKTDTSFRIEVLDFIPAGR